MRPLRGLQETRVATREESGVLGFPSRRGLTPRGTEGTRDADLVPVWGRSPGGGHGYPLQYSCLENSMDRGESYDALPLATRMET